MLDVSRGTLYYTCMVNSNQPNGNPNTNEDNKNKGNGNDQPKTENKKEETKVEDNNPPKVETSTDKKEDANKDADRVVIESYEKKLADQKKTYEEKIKARDDRIRQLINGEVTEKENETPSVAEIINKRRAYSKW